MTTGELIEWLRKMPQDTIVTVPKLHRDANGDFREGWAEVRRVTLFMSNGPSVGHYEAVELWP